MADVLLDARGAVLDSVADAFQRAGHDDPNAHAQDWLSAIEAPDLTTRYYLTIGLLVLGLEPIVITKRT